MALKYRSFFRIMFEAACVTWEVAWTKYGWIVKPIIFGCVNAMSVRSQHINLLCGVKWVMCGNTFSNLRRL